MEELSFEAFTTIERGEEQQTFSQYVTSTPALAQAEVSAKAPVKYRNQFFTAELDIAPRGW